MAHPLVRSLACALALLAARAAGATPPAKDWEVEIAPYGWLAMARGARFVRAFFLVVVSGFVVRIGGDLLGWW